MSPLYELSTTALTVILIIGAITALFMGLLGIVNNDIKRVIAYSTLSQLGYMTVGLGASAYAASMFHLMTHAFFKALLFLGAGSVIIALHHEQDMRRMGGLRRYMPITYWTALIGSLALCGIPPFAGFFSKDSLIEAVHLSATPGAGIAHAAVLLGVFVTALYTFRMLFMTFHGEERFRHAQPAHHGEHEEPDATHHAPVGTPHESPLVVTVPLIALAIPSVYAGWAYIEPLLFGDYFKGAIVVSPAHDALAKMGEEFHGVPAFVLHGLTVPTFWFALAGIVTAWYLYIVRPKLPAVIAQRARGVYRLLANKYYFDELYQAVFANGARAVGTLLWKLGDVAVIDGFLVNGSARLVGGVSSVIRRVQSGRVYHYAFMMILGLFVLLTWWIARA
jgi:NADH-quinone oxidoreductase subunit L